MQRCRRPLPRCVRVRVVEDGADNVYLTGANGDNGFKIASSGIRTASESGFVGMSLLILTAGTLVYARQRGPRVAG